MPDDAIPLYDGEPTGAKIIHQEQPSEGANTQSAVRSKRSSPRKACDRVHVCFSLQRQLGRVEHIECPVVNMSAGGFAIEFDEALAVGVTGHIAYWTISHRPVRVSCSVRRCQPLDHGRYLLGIRLDRKLDFEERRPARIRAGRDVAMGLRPRKLREAEGGHSGM
jgi:hypothetical protein